MGYSFPMENIEADNAHKTARSEAKVGRSAAAIKACLSCVSTLTCRPPSYTDRERDVTERETFEV